MMTTNSLLAMEEMETLVMCKARRQRWTKDWGSKEDEIFFLRVDCYQECCLIYTSK